MEKPGNSAADSIKKELQNQPFEKSGNTNKETDKVTKDTREEQLENLKNKETTIKKAEVQSAKNTLQGLLEKLTLDSMKTLHDQVESTLYVARGIIDNPESSQEEVDNQVKILQDLINQVNAVLSEIHNSETENPNEEPQNEINTVSRRGRRGSTQNQPDQSNDTSSDNNESHNYINGKDSYTLSEKMHKLYAELKKSESQNENIEKFKESYDKLNEELGKAENGLVDQTIFNTALEEYKKASLLQSGEISNSEGNLRSIREESSLKVGVAKGRKSDPKLSNEKIIPSDGHPVGNNIRFLAESSSGKEIRRITVKAYDPQANSGRGGFTVDAVKNKLGLTTSGLQGSGSKKWVDLTGHMPDNRFGVNNIVVEAEDSSGHTQTTTVGITRPLPKASFTTKNEALAGKANKEDNDRPVVSGRIPYPVETNNIPSDAEFKAYLVTGGRVNNERYIPGASDYTTIAVTRIKTDGTFNFVPPEYIKDTIGTTELKLVVKYTKRGTNETYYEGLESLFSNDSLQATEPVDKDSAKTELDRKAQEKKNSFNTIQHLTAEEKAAANKKVDDAVTDAKGKIDQATTKAGVDQAKSAGLTAIGSINPQPGTLPIPNPEMSNLTNQNQNNISITKPEQPSQTTDNRNNLVPSVPNPDTLQHSSEESTVATLTNGNSRSTETVNEIKDNDNKPVDKSELQKLVQDLEALLKTLDGVDSSVITSAKAVLIDAKATLASDNLTEKSLREVTVKVKTAIDSLKGIKTGQTNKNKKEAGEDKQETVKEESESHSNLSVGAVVTSIAALLGILLFIAARRKKKSALKGLSKELTDLLEKKNFVTVDKNLVKKAKKMISNIEMFEKGNYNVQTEKELIENVKSVIEKLRK